MLKTFERILPYPLAVPQTNAATHYLFSHCFNLFEWHLKQDCCCSQCAAPDIIQTKLLYKVIDLGHQWLLFTTRKQHLWWSLIVVIIVALVSFSSTIIAGSSPLLSLEVRPTIEDSYRWCFEPAFTELFHCRQFFHVVQIFNDSLNILIKSAQNAIKICCFWNRNDTCVYVLYSGRCVDRKKLSRQYAVKATM